MKQRKPHPYNPSTIVTPEDEREWLETLAARDESNATALDNWYAQDEWVRRWHAQARETCQRAQGITRP